MAADGQWRLCAAGKLARVSVKSGCHGGMVISRDSARAKRRENAMVGPGKTVFLAALALSLLAAPALLAQAPTAPAPAQATDTAGEETTLAAKTILYARGSGKWETAHDTLLEAFKAIYAAIEKQGLKADGPAMTIITEFDDVSFRFEAAVPITEAPANFPGGDIAVGKSPDGKAFKFVYRGAYGKPMEPLFGTILDFFEEKRLEARDFYVEEFTTDLLTTPRDKLVVHVFMPVK
jgi:effector-binding domain-containing protein